MSGVVLDAALRAAYLQLLEHQFGLRIPVRQSSHLDEVVLQLLPTTSFTQPAELHAALAAGLLPELLRVLATSMTVGETHFFRVTPQIEALRHLILPDLIARRSVDRRLRLWSAGCSTGEEPYTLAMLVGEQLSGQPGPDWDIQLVATDLNAAALDVARAGTYGAWSFRDTPPEARARYFTPNGDRWRISDQVRRMVRFAQLNLAEDPFPFGSKSQTIDLILCRNVTIYFGPTATQRLYIRFAEALQPHGWLVLGPSDPVPAPTSELQMTALDGAVLWQRRQPAAIKPLPARVEPVARVKQADLPSPPGPSMDPLVHLHAGMVQLDEGASAAAIDSFRRAAFLDETSALVQFSLGRAYRQIGDPLRSRSAFARARRLLAGQGDDQLLAGGELASGELRHAVDSQLADLDQARS